MPKGKGGKKKKRGASDTKREIPLKEPGQEYARIGKVFGDERFECQCFDGKKRIGHIRGKLRKREWATAGDIVLLGLRSYQDDKADILAVYKGDEARCLKKLGEIPEDTKVADAPNGELTVGDNPFEFMEQEEQIKEQPKRASDFNNMTMSDDSDLQSEEADLNKL